MHLENLFLIHQSRWLFESNQEGKIHLIVLAFVSFEKYKISL